MTRVAVLLPARMETRFDQHPRRGTDRLRVLVVPAEPWFDRHDPQVTRTELALARRAAVTATKQGAEPGPTLVAQLGARGAWLAATLLRQDGSGWDLVDPLPPVRADADPAPPAVVRGLPDRLEVWASLADGRQRLLAALNPQPELRVEPPAHRHRRGTTDGDATFWPRWEELRHAGLATTIDLATADPDGPIAPADIEVLTVVGLGEDEPGLLLGAHQAAGALGLLPAGAPTNATPDAAVTDPRVPGAAVPLDPALSDVSAAVGVELAVPGSSHDGRAAQELLTTALWPALWGHALQDLWRWPPGEDAGRIRTHEWWARHVHPLGPWPTLLVGDQPYGLLPATHLARVADLAGELPAVEVRTAAATRAYLRAAAQSAERGVGTMVDADTDGVLRVLAQTPVSTRHQFRWAVPARWLPSPLAEAWARRVDEVVGGIDSLDASQLANPQLAIGASAPLRIPLLDAVGDGDPPEWVYRMLDDLDSFAAGDPDLARDLHALHEVRPKEHPHRVALLWLWWWSRQEAPGPGVGDVQPVIERFREFRAMPGLLVRLVLQSLRVAHAWPPDDGAADQAYRAVLESTRALALAPAARADRELLLRGTLDCATHRLDALPAAVGLARLEAVAGAPRHLGLYAWVDRPFRGEPGFTDRGAVLAPSPDLAKAAAILKDRYAEDVAHSGPSSTTWSMQLDSARVRRAVRLLDAVREGAHPTEAMGRDVEALFDYPAAMVLRRDYPADDDAPLRRTCDGLRVLTDWRRDPAGFATHPRWQPAGFDLTVSADLDALAEVAAVVADLLLLEAVHDTVQGGSATTAQSLDALAGLGSVPALRSLQTPTAGTVLTTRVHLCVPVGRGRLPRLGQGRAVSADPAFAALLDSLGDPADALSFGWAAEGGQVTLAGLGLRLSDLAAVDDAALHTALVSVSPALADAPAPSGPARVRAVARLLTRACGAAPATDDGPALRDRYSRLHTDLADLVEAVEAGAPAPALNRRALRWGIVAASPEHVALVRDRFDVLPLPADVEDVDVDDVRVALRRLAAVAQPDGVADVVPVTVVPRVVGAQRGADPWRRTFAPVRPVLGEVRDLLGRRITRVTADRGGAQWTGHPLPGQSGGPGHARELGVYLSVDGADPAADAVVVVDEWQETLPGRWTAAGPEPATVSATAAFGFNAPGARAPQAVILVAPPTPDGDVDLDTVREVIGETRDLARVRTLRGRDLGPWGVLAPSAYLPAERRGGVVLDDERWDLPTEEDGLHVRLEQGTPEGDVDQALRAETADPLWMLARQWQLGEHQGENATSPVWATARTRHTPLTVPADRAFADPTALPGEVVLEAAGRDWRPAQSGPDPYRPDRLDHAVTMKGGGATFSANDHRGGTADWWSVDADGSFRPGGPTHTQASLPGRMRYPGAPAPGWWTLEDPRDTTVAHLPDSAHVGSLFFLDVLAGHATDWYLVHVATPPGHVLTVRDVTVLDSFGDRWKLADEHWADPTDWSVFGTRGLGGRDLLAWAGSATALEGPVVERVRLGVDEDANVLWVVEDVVEGAGALPPDAVMAPQFVRNGVPRVRFEPLGTSPERWHPYVAVTDSPPRRYRQGRLATAAEAGVTPLPSAGSRIIPDDGGHEVLARVVPARGVVVERRWRLARANDGTPVVWQERRTRVPQAPPAYRMAFDTVTPDP